MSTESDRTEKDVLNGPTGKTDKPVIPKTFYIQTYPDADGNAAKCDKMQNILAFGVQRMEDKPAIGMSDYARIFAETIEQIKAVLEPNESPDEPKPVQQEPIDSTGHPWMLDKIQELLHAGIGPGKIEPSSDIVRRNSETMHQIVKVITRPPGNTGCMLVPMSKTALDRFDSWNDFLENGDPEILCTVERSGRWLPEAVGPLQAYLKEAPGVTVSVLARIFLLKMKMDDFLSQGLEMAHNDLLKDPDEDEHPF